MHIISTKMCVVYMDVPICVYVKRSCGQIDRSGMHFSFRSFFCPTASCSSTLVMISYYKRCVLIATEGGRIDECAKGGTLTIETESERVWFV